VRLIDAFLLCCLPLSASIVQSVSCSISTNSGFSEDTNGNFILLTANAISELSGGAFGEREQARWE
jgi:hypothetical protein